MAVRSFFTSDAARTLRPAVLPTFANVFGPKSARITTATMIQWMALIDPMGRDYTRSRPLGYRPER